MNEALRQFRHNNSDDFVFAYDKEIIDKAIASLRAQLAEKEEENERVKGRNAQLVSQLSIEKMKKRMPPSALLSKLEAAEAQLVETESCLAEMSHIAAEYSQEITILKAKCAKLEAHLAASDAARNKMVEILFDVGEQLGYPYGDEVNSTPFSQAIARLQAKCAAMEGKLIEAYEAGYERGHNDTVERCYGDAKELAEEHFSECREK